MFLSIHEISTSHLEDTAKAFEIIILERDTK